MVGNTGDIRPSQTTESIQMKHINKTFDSRDDSYDPHLHRNPPFPTTNFETLIHLIKGAVGTAILAMPKAFYNSGLILGAVSTVLIGALTTLCFHMLINVQYELCKRLKIPMLSFRESFAKSLEIGPKWMRPFAKYSAVLVDVLLVIDLFGMCCCHLIFVAENIKAVSDTYITKLELRVHMLILMIPLVLLSFIKNLKKLAPLSLLGNCLCMAGVSIIIYIACKDEIDFNGVDYVGEWSNYPLFFSTVLFSLEVVGVAITLENNMKNPKDFGGYFGVWNQGMIIITTLNLLVGFFGYLKYKATTQDAITLNLDEGGLSVAVQLMFTVAILISYVLVFHSPIDILWNTYMKVKFEDKSRHTLYEYMLRTGCVLFTFGISMLIPNLGDFISLFGALCVSALGILFPAIMEICIKWHDNLSTWNLAKNVILIIISLLAFLAGTYCSLYDIVQDIERELSTNSTMLVDMGPLYVDEHSGPL